MSQNSAIDLDRLQEILRPVREYWAVWDISLVPFLDDYLSNISSIDISEDFNPEALNFSQAGLLIQGSTNIFAKKVKHLYDLVTASTSIPDQSDENGKQGKRKKKQIDWVIDDKLAPIEDIEQCDTTILEEDEPRLEITTMPKIPFCLLHSLDSQTKSDQPSFRINMVPDEKYSVILLDSSLNFEDYVDSTSEPLDRRLLVPDEDNGSLVHFGNPLEIPQSPNKIPNEELPSINIPSDEEKDTSLLNDIPITNDIPMPDESSQPKPKKKDKNEKPKPLDPDAANLTLTIRPFKKMKKFQIPSSFEDKKGSKSKKSMKKPFHVDIFNELFEKVKTYREKRLRAEDIEAIEAIPIENGREHILDELDTFVEDQPIDNFMPSDDEQVIPNNIQYNDDQTSQYNTICKNFVMKMIEEGRRSTITSSSISALSEWERKLTPILEKEQNRKPFNISDTRDWIISLIEAKSGQITFQNLISGLQSFEVSRVFLSTLMLANTKVIEIVRDGYPSDNFLIKLLTDAHPQFNDAMPE